MTQSSHPKTSPCLSRTVCADIAPDGSAEVANVLLPPDKFPSSAAFDAISEALASDADKKAAIKQGQAVFAFTLKNTAGETESWHIDLKNKGTVGKGLGEKPTGKHTCLGIAQLCECDGIYADHHCLVTLSLSDADFANLVSGKGNAQRLFMSGKLKIKGDVMKATKLDPILKKAQTKAKL